MSIFLIVLGLIICFIPCFMNGGEAAGNLFIVGISIFMIGIIGRTISKSSKQAKKAVYATYDKDKRVLHVLKRGTELRTMIKINEAKNYTTKDTPVKVHYGSATVGGVTTGGVYTTGGQTVFTGSYSTGKWELDYIDIEVGAGALTQDKTHYRIIEKITLTPELLEKAKSSAISKYVSGDGIQVISSSKMSLDEVRYAMNNLNSTHTQDMTKRGYPTQEKCQEILNWLSSTL